MPTPVLVPGRTGWFGWRGFFVALFVPQTLIAIVTVYKSVQHFNDPVAYVMLAAVIGWLFAIAALYRYCFKPAR